MADVYGCVYMLHNQQTGEAYFGRSNNARRRLTETMSGLKRGVHHNKDLQAAYDKNPNFDFIPVPMVSEEDRMEFEQSLIDEFAECPFVFNEALSSRGGTVLTESSKQKQREMKLGKPLTEEHCRKLAEANAGRVVPEEIRQMGLAARRRKIRVGSAVYESLAEASHAHGIAPGTAHHRLNVSTAYPEWSYVNE